VAAQDMMVGAQCRGGFFTSQVPGSPVSMYIQKIPKTCHMSVHVYQTDFFHHIDKIKNPDCSFSEE
jgi:hypothetical protein